ncbi:MAG: protein translocase subunit SecD [Candidatus Aminicenantes bacterium]|nr:protein translocase subunit SecD [Candidatus Aminicenantes bacterium]
MKKALGWKIILILVVIGLSVWRFLEDKIVLGLDLRGGTHLVLEVQTGEGLIVQTDQHVTRLKSLFKDASIKYEKVTRKGVTGIEVSGFEFEDERNIKDIFDDDFREWNYTFSARLATMKLKPNEAMRWREQTVNQALEKIRNRIDATGLSEAKAQRIEGFSQKGDKLLVLLPGIDDPGRIKEIIKTTAMLEWKEVVSGPFDTEEEALSDYGGKLPEDLVVLKMNPKTGGRKGFMILKAANIVSGNDLRNAKRTRNEYGAPIIGFSLHPKGGRAFEKYTAANIGKRLAVVLDKRVLIDPVVQTVIPAHSGGVITGSYTTELVDDMVVMLRAGALPASMKFLEERTVGPSLGADSIRKGIYASSVGLLLVMAFMLLYYKAAGINSVVALALNIVILMGVLAYFRATLTVPGIAGIILTIGMAVDANVLIFERIKEELRAGKSPKSSIDSGFKKAFVTIFDANLTTIIAAIFLYQFGTGPIQGFAVTLMIGITASMFTAVFVSRVIFDLIYGDRKKLKKVSV